MKMFYKTFICLCIYLQFWISTIKAEGECFVDGPEWEERDELSMDADDNDFYALKVYENVQNFKNVKEIENNPYVSWNMSADKKKLTFFVTDEFKYYIQNQNELKIRSKIILECSNNATLNNKYFILRVNEKTNYSPKFDEPEYNFKLKVPILENQIIDNTEISLTDLNINENIIFSLNEDDPECKKFETVSIERVNKIFFIKLKAKHYIDLNKNITCIVTAEDKAGAKDTVDINLSVDIDNSKVPTPQIKEPLYQKDYVENLVIDVDLKSEIHKPIALIEQKSQYFEVQVISNNKIQVKLKQIPEDVVHYLVAILKVDYEGAEDSARTVILINMPKEITTTTECPTVPTTTPCEPCPTTTTYEPCTTQSSPPTSSTTCEPCECTTESGTTPTKTTTECPPVVTCPPCEISTCPDYSTTTNSDSSTTSDIVTTSSSSTTVSTTTCPPCEVTTCPDYSTTTGSDSSSSTTSGSDSSSSTTSGTTITSPITTDVITTCPPCEITTCPSVTCPDYSTTTGSDSSSSTTSGTTITSPITTDSITTCPPCEITTCPSVTCPDHTTTSSSITTCPSVTCPDCPITTDLNNSTTSGETTTDSGNSSSHSTITDSNSSSSSSSSETTTDSNHSTLTSSSGTQCPPCECSSTTSTCEPCGTDVIVTFNKAADSYKFENDYVGEIDTFEATSSITELISYTTVIDQPGAKGKFKYSNKVLFITEKLDEGKYKVILTASGNISRSKDEANIFIHISSPKLVDFNETTKYFDKSLSVKTIKEHQKGFVLYEHDDDYKFKFTDDTQDYIHDWFEINDKGNLVTKEIDREDDRIKSIQPPQIQFKIKAIKNSNFYTSSNYSHLALNLQNMDTEYKCLAIENIYMDPNVQVIVVKVDDINDNYPVFLETSPLIIGYPDEDLKEFITPPYLVKVTATDKDTGLNAKIQYNLDNGMFYIDSETGIITPTSLFTFTDIKFNVIAADSGEDKKKSELHVQVKILKEENILVLMLKDINYGEVNDKINEISEKTGKTIKYLTSSATVIDEIVSEKQYSNYQSHYKENFISAVKVILYAIDEKNEPMLAKDFKKVFENAGMDAELLITEYEKPTSAIDETGWIAAVSTLSVLLALIIIGVLVGYFVFIRKKLVTPINDNYEKNISNGSSHLTPIEKKLDTSSSIADRRPTGFPIGFKAEDLDDEDDNEVETKKEENKDKKSDSDSSSDSDTSSNIGKDRRKSVVTFNTNVTEIEIEDEKL